MTDDTAGIETDDHAVQGPLPPKPSLLQCHGKEGAKASVGYGSGQGGCRLPSLFRLPRARTGEQPARVSFSSPF
ncbi:hypothetical protein [Paenibacillus thiaminolyticus]|uniref:Uncharacterized protein n=1 Tax=Paenibacillus thiaminolyticus TaxID=49283 RepID=A0A3A3GDY8_PANTH|nr:hypothetical protein [Paenibacillus thiaminolyticus]RJG20831.1 hypothetical protein DQX05_23520 [Paenibacillus thiaminolyticus]